ncbi:MAG: hypothetical protein IT176_07450 [Acidobacteria bacterium]|nr:hypothetical protein [Acidobacteriota bacterium]
MALTGLQRDVCRLLAAARRAGGESYVAGGAALGVALDTSRVSRDHHVFHDTAEAVAGSWDRDRAILQQSGFAVSALRERPGYVEAIVSRGQERLVVEWARDSAFRFFPLVDHDDFGLVLHPFDLATNKVLALVGRLEARDWVDVIAAHERLQPLAYLAWAASGKDPGFTPAGILAQASRSSRYSDGEIAALAFDGEAPSAADLSRRWHRALEAADSVLKKLPAAHVGQAVLTTAGELFTGDGPALERALAAGEVAFHAGRVKGAWPAVRL